MAAARAAFKNFFDRDKTFRPKKRLERGTLKFSLHKQANASLNSGIDLKEVVKLPPGEDVNDWIAVHVVDFFNRINLLYGTVSENCTEQSCPTMSGGPRYKYHWCDGVHYKKPTALPAPQYITLLMEYEYHWCDGVHYKKPTALPAPQYITLLMEYEYHWCDGVHYKKPTALPAPQYITLLMEWVESQINDESLFPVQIGSPFPKNYLSVVKKILKRLFRVFVHGYIHHFDKLVAMGAEAHINTCYKHFYYFVTEYNLIDKKELEPLREMTERICH
ncbi:hypothetical protein ACOMHN_015160 [Nucella lapillus]